MPHLSHILRISAVVIAAFVGPCGALWGQTPRGSLVIVGGGPIPPEINKRFVELAGGAGKAFVVTIPMAAADPDDAGTGRVEIFRSEGVEAVSVTLTRALAQSDSVARLLARATGVWFPGGVQSRLADTLVGTRALDSIRSRYNAGAVIGGTSAGAAVMSDPMITGDERRPGGSRPLSDTSSPAFMTIDRDNVVVSRGLALLPGVIVDQHFLRRRRHNRLISRVLEGPQKIGAGIDEATALVVLADGSWEVIGESQVVVYDAREAVPAAGSIVGATGVRLHVLAPGSRWRP
ncbi:MAG: cyanophycinase [Gemmatimonadota bacterium]